MAPVLQQLGGRSEDCMHLCEVDEASEQLSLGGGVGAGDGRWHLKVHAQLRQQLLVASWMPHPALAASVKP